jgi:prefoldin subunit 5
VNGNIDSISRDIDELQTAVNTTLPNSISKVASDAATNLSNAITQEVKDRNTAIGTETAARTEINNTIFSILGEDDKITDVTKNHKSRLDNIENKLSNISNIMDFVGVVGSMPPSGSYQKGDVCIYQEKEYVYDGDFWQEIGDTTRLANIETKVNTINNTTIPGINTNITSLNGRIEAVENRATSLENIVGGDGDTLYIIDGNNNTIAYFNNSGLTVHNVIVENTQKSKMKNL